MRRITKVHKAELHFESRQGKVTLTVTDEGITFECEGYSGGADGVPLFISLNPEREKHPTVYFWNHDSEDAVCARSMIGANKH